MARLGRSEAEIDTMPWYRQRGYIEAWAEQPYVPVVLIDPEKLPGRPGEPSRGDGEMTSLDDLAALGFQVRSA